MERTLKIAICDDEQTYLDILEDECLRFLECRNQKAQIFCFQRGKALLSSEDEFDIILLDVELPDMDGFFCGRVEEPSETRKDHFYNEP